MSTPLSPEPVTRSGNGDLPAYASNGLIGLRVLDIPLLPGIAIVNGFVGVHPTMEVESAAQAPYPLAGDIGVDGTWLTKAPHQATFVDQRYDFDTGELTTRFDFAAAGRTVRAEVLTFCSRTEPTLVLQEVAVQVDRACDLVLRALIDVARVHGGVATRHTSSPGGKEAAAEGSIRWESLGGRSRCGISYVTELVGAPEATKERQEWGIASSLATDYRIEARAGRTYRLRQIVSVVPDVLHPDPDRMAFRLASRAAEDGFESIRRKNRDAWRELWDGRIVIASDDDRWQQFADAAFFYLNSSVHSSAPASTSIFGLAQWIDYHYYYGHVMWDIEMFSVPPLLLSQPDAARSLLDFRTLTLQGARNNALLNGRRGLQFPWESGPRHGDEVAPGGGEASWHEDHVSLDVARAFADYVYATGDIRFLRDKASVVLYGVADWIASRVTPRRDGYDIRQTMGIAERKKASDNDAFTIMSAKAVLLEAIEAAERLGDPADDRWRDIAVGLKVRPSPENGAVMSHDGFHPNEEKGATPGPLAGLFPVWHDMPPQVAQATLEYYLRLAPGYVGSPMLSPLFGVWACWAGDRRLALRLLEQGYADLVGGRFLQTLEVAPSVFPDKPRAGPFFANLGGFLMGLVYGLPGIRLGAGDPQTWPSRRVVLPQGWRSIEVERAWIRGKPARILARHGSERAIIENGRTRRRHAA